MPGWYLALRDQGSDLAIQVGISVIAGFVVAGIFRATIVSRDRTGSITTTLVLLTVLTAVLTLVIGDNMARAFGLVGALSIVRFRTVVEDTRDTAFVIFAVVIGMAVGADRILLAAMAAVAVAFVAASMRWVVPGGRTTGICKLQLCVRVAPGQETGPLVEVINRYAGEVKTVGAATAKQGSAMEVTYSLRLTGEPEAMVPFFAELSRIEGVQSVELKENTRS